MTLENPFPGMNPWLERRWGDVHTRLIAYATDQLEEALPADLQARMQEHVFIESAEEARRYIEPDVHIYETPAATVAAAPGTGGGGGLAVAQVETEPVLIDVDDVEVTERHIEIVDAGDGGRVVTAIEFISRSNRPSGPGRDRYLRKQQAARDAGVNLVEIDLLRGGRPVTLIPPSRVPPVHRAPYHVCVRRAARPNPLEYYPVQLRGRLPSVRIPLRASDRDVRLDLQAALNRAYRKGRYWNINYAEPPHPPLSANDAAWARDVLTAAGLLPPAAAGGTSTGPSPSAPPT